MPTPTRFSSALLSGAFLLCPALLSAGTTIHVSAVHDELGGGGCSLRAAVIAANTDTTVDSCPAGSGADTIVLPAGTFGLSLAGPNEDYARTGDLDIRGAVTIQGAGADQTVIAGNHLVDPAEWWANDRVLHVSAHGSLTLTGVAVRSGRCYSGGGIANHGRLSIVDSEIVGNQTSAYWSCGGGGNWGGGGSIYNRGERHVLRSRVMGTDGTDGFAGDTTAPGGAIYNAGRATVVESLIWGWAAAGGGIFNEGGLRLVDSRLAGSARFMGAALDNDGGSAVLTRDTVDASVGLGTIVNGHGINGAPSKLLIENSTVSGNTNYRLAAISNVNGEVKVVGSTVTGNEAWEWSAGIAGVVHLTNTVVAGNVGAPNCDAYAVSHGYNADSDNSCNLGTAGDQPNVDPRLGPLADHGGPTPTHALFEDSPLLDRIPAGLCRFPTDQRGVARPAGGACDIGAFERGPGDLFAPDRNDD